MTTLLHTFIAMEPRGKERPRFVRATGRTYTPTKTVRAENRIQEQVAREYKSAPCEGPLMLVVTAFLPKPKSKPKNKHCWPTSKPDWDNLGKLVSDALNGIVYRDDSQITWASVQKCYCTLSHPKPGFMVTVQTVDSEELNIAGSAQ